MLVNEDPSEANPIVLKRVAAYLEPLIPPGIEVLAGLEMGGIPIATALSLQSNIPADFVRREARNGEWTICSPPGRPLRINN